MMTKEELAEEIENKGVEYADSINYSIPKFSDENGYCWSQVEEAYEKGALDFAEPREKRIEELKKENQDLRDNYEQFKAITEPEIERLKKENTELRNNGFTVSAMTEQQLKVAIEKGKQLEKENAELKEEIKAKQVVLNDFKSRVETVTDRFNTKSSQLTKATAILKKFIETSNPIYFDEDRQKVKAEAEQFIKEIEND